MLGLSAVPAVIQFLGFLFLPESPRWLIQKGQTQRARRILSQMRGNQAIDEEYDSIKNNIEEEEKEVGAGMLSACWPLYQRGDKNQKKCWNRSLWELGVLLFLVYFAIWNISYTGSLKNEQMFLQSYSFKLGSDFLSERKVKLCKILSLYLPHLLRIALKKSLSLRMHTMKTGNKWNKVLFLSSVEKTKQMPGKSEDILYAWIIQRLYPGPPYSRQAAFGKIYQTRHVILFQ